MLREAAFTSPSPETYEMIFSGFPADSALPDACNRCRITGIHYDDYIIVQCFEFLRGYCREEELGRFRLPFVGMLPRREMNMVDEPCHDDEYIKRSLSLSRVSPGTGSGWLCPVCGTIQNSKFCGKCGAPDPNNK